LWYWIYTCTEDNLAWNLFIAASDDPFVGTAPKAKDFWKIMHKNNRKILSWQLHLVQLKYYLAAADASLLISEPIIFE
jgi:hypothetical protein